MESWFGAETYKSIMGVLDSINDFMYSKFLIFLLIAVGLYFTIRTRFVQGRLFGDSIKTILEKKENEDSLSSFQTLMIATASRVGTGNIAGVTTAIVLGGYGAVFWMWILAIIGGASAFVETTLAQVYKEREGAIYKGGPSYYIQRALGQRWLGIVFSILLILTFAFGFNGLQSQTISSSFKLYVDNYDSSIYPIIIGAIMAVYAAYLFFGGAQKIAKVSSIIVPIMAVIYIVVGLVIFFTNIDKLGSSLSTLFSDAFDFQKIFDPNSVAGGFAGSCMVQGIKRGLFSNEAGMGSAPNAAAAAEVSHPAKQGMVQVLSVFIDTIIICSTTAFIVMLAGPIGLTDDNGDLVNGIPFVQKALESQFGFAGIVFITICIILFAGTSIIGNYFYAEFNMKFISENKTSLMIFRILAVAMIFIGAQLDLQMAWNLADITMGFMATVNCIAMLLLGGVAVKVLKDYEKQRSNGLNPVFLAKNVGLDNTDCWK